jgi:secreted PhoX family phosphatase
VLAGTIGSLVIAGTAHGGAHGGAGVARGAAQTIGPLLDPDGNGLRLPAGFRSRVIARTGEQVAGTGFVWHQAPDGGATFATDDGGWIYVSNSEVPVSGGASAVRFDADGKVVAAYSILSDTSVNCAGGPTPWGTWLSCEEHERGLVWECDPTGSTDARALPALGRFPHEAAAVDPDRGVVYLTEDRNDSLLYRFTPDQEGDLTAGHLEAAQVADDGSVTWLAAPGDAGSIPLRLRMPDATRFRRGEGAWFADGRLVFATTADARLWVLEDDHLTVLYEGGSDTPLQGPDNVTVSPGGTVIAAEDGGNMELVAITEDGAFPLLQITGHDGSEVAGPAFTPDGSRLYFSSQRGTGGEGTGVTFEVTGPFHELAGAQPAPTTSVVPPTTSPPSTGAAPPLAPHDTGDLDPLAVSAGTGVLVVVLAGLGWVSRRRRALGG